ncbi:MAG: RNA methyltransferase [Methylotenera sp.]|nr:RNA methyltransferase [Oligoflexia bacterium]
MTNRLGELVTTAVTNMDIHDISRSARTYGIRKYFIVNPLEIQHELVGRLLGHWQTEHSRMHHPDRVSALSVARLARDFDEVKKAIRDEHGEEPEVVLTDARPLPNSISYADYRQELMDPKRTRPCVLVFGTGWGVAEIFHPEVHRILAPVYGPKDEEGEGYNHLSVRSAVAIILDRLFGH